MSQEDLFKEIENNNLDEARRLVASGVSSVCTNECWRSLLHSTKSFRMREFLRSVNPEAYSVWEKEQDLMKACQIGDLNIAKDYIGSGVSIKCRDKCGRSPLHFASRNDIRDFLRDLDPAAFSIWEREQELITACENGHLDEAKHLVSSGVSVTCRDEIGATPLHCAVCNGHIEVAEWLLSSGASLTDRNQDGRTATHYAVINGFEGITLWLLRSGASLTDRDEEREQHLIKACERGDLEEAKRLVDSGVSVNCRDEIGQAPLLIAVYNNKEEMARLLIDGGADVDIQDLRGETALMKAASGNELEVARLLIDRGASLDLPDHNGRTALLITVSYYNEKIVRLLVDSGAHMNIQDNRGYSPLMRCRSDGVESARLLIDRGASTSLLNKDGYTAFMIAVNNNSQDIARLLLERGAADQQEVRVALNCARERGHHDMTSLLMKQLRWLSRRGFLMFLATQSYLPAAPPPEAETMPRDELNNLYLQLYNPETRSFSSAVHAVFFMDEMRRCVASFLGPE